MDFKQYGTLLIRLNNTTVGNSSWVIEDGMGLYDEAVWWPSQWRKRPVAHEGLDLVRYQVGPNYFEMFSGFLVVSPVSGVVVGICDDFLSQTLWVNPDSNPDQLVLLSHVTSAVEVGQRLLCGDPVGDISYRVTTVPLHLHLSVLVGPWRELDNMTWDGVHALPALQFVYPSF